MKIEQPTSDTSGGALLTANNGLTATGTNVQLGGALVQNTLITGASSTYTLDFSGLLSSSMGGDSAGVFRRISQNANLFGLSVNGDGLFAGDAATFGTSTNVAVTYAGKNSGSEWVTVSEALSSAYDVSIVSNATTGDMTLKMLDKGTNFYTSLFLDENSVVIGAVAGASNQNILAIDSGTRRYYFENLAEPNAMILGVANAGTHQQTGFNLPFNTTLTSTVTTNGSEATNVLRIQPTPGSGFTYTFDSNDADVPDNTIYADTQLAGSSITISAVPASIDFRGREFTVVNGVTGTSVPYSVRVNFTAADFNGANGSDFIQDSAYESVTYKSVQNSASPLKYTWIRKSVNQHRPAIVTGRYADPYIAINRAYCQFVVGLGGASGATTVDLSDVNIEIGSQVEVSDGGLAASSNNITVDAGTGSFILGSSSAQTFVISTNGASYLFTKVSSTQWKVN